MSLLRTTAVACVALVAAGAVRAQDAPAPEQAPAPPALDDKIVLNGMGGFAIDALKDFRDRPLFVPSRQPPPPPPVFEPEPEPEPEPPEPVAVDEPIVPPDVQLSGILEGGEGSVAILKEAGGGQTTSVRKGDMVGEWTVTAIGPSNLTLENRGAVLDLKLFEPGRTPPADPASGDDSSMTLGEAAQPGDGGDGADGPAADDAFSFPDEGAVPGEEVPSEDGMASDGSVPPDDGSSAAGESYAPFQGEFIPDDEGQVPPEGEAPPEDLGADGSIFRDEQPGEYDPNTGEGFVAPQRF